MVIPERHVRIQIADIVIGCRKYIFHPKQYNDLTKKFDDAAAKLDGIGLIFKEGKMARYLTNYREELSHLRMLAGIEPRVVDETDDQKSTQDNPGIGLAPRPEEVCCRLG